MDFSVGTGCMQPFSAPRTNNLYYYTVTMTNIQIECTLKLFQPFPIEMCGRITSVFCNKIENYQNNK